MASIELDGILKHYVDDQSGQSGDRPALNRVSLQIADGETVSVVGSSGCGKSTLLKLIAGLEHPDQGRISFNGTDVTDARPQDRGIGMVFQDYALYPTMKGKGNLAYYFDVNDTTEEEAEQKVRETAERMGVGFDLLLGQVPTTLSGGEQQRVAIARCIVRDPELFLMDEPICNLDAKLRERTRIEIKKLLKKFGITTLYVTHDQQEAIFMGDRIAVMREGSIEQIGTFDELYYSPASRFVATFIGAPPLAVLPAVAHAGYLAVNDVAWKLPGHLDGVLPDGPVDLGVRPENWLLDQHDGLTLQVRHLERIPTERAAFAHGTVGGRNVSVILPVDHPDSSELRLTPDLERAYFFEHDGERPLHSPGALELF